MVKAMIEVNLPSFGYFAYSLQLVLNDGILCQHGVRDLLAISRSILGHFKHSNIACHKLAQIQENLHLLKHKNDSTKWNSTLYMVESILE